MITTVHIEARVKVKYGTCKRFTGHDFLQVVFTFRIPRTNNKEGNGPFNKMVLKM